MLGESLLSTPASIPADVSDYFVPPGGYVRPTADCSPYSCPGYFVSTLVPYEVLKTLLTKARSLVPITDQQAITSLAFGVTTFTPVPPPPAWDAYRRGTAVEYQKLQAEVFARLHAFVLLFKGYRPWTADEICAMCKLWRQGGWEWAGVPAIRSSVHEQLHPGEPWIITCGMLKDAGKIATAEDCQAEDRKAVQAYIDFVTARQRRSGGGLFGTIMLVIANIAILVIGVVVSVFTAGALAPAVGVAAAAGIGALVGSLSATVLAWGLKTAVTGDISISVRDVLEELAKALTAAVTAGLGMIGQILKTVVDAAKAAYEFIEKLEEQRRTERRLDEAAQRVEAKTKELENLLKARAELDELEAKALELDAQIKAEQAEGVATTKATLTTGSLLLVGGLAVAALALRR